MRSTLKILSLIILVLAFASQAKINAAETADFSVEVLEIKDLGISANDDSKSIVEVRWRVNPTLVANVASFNLVLSVTYADGTTTYIKRQTDGKSLSMRVEVSSVNISKGKSTAFIKKLNATVTAVIPEKQF